MTSKSIILLLGASLLVVLLAVAGFLYFSYAATAGQLPLSALASQVSISQPENGAEIAIYQPLSVEAMAIGPAPYLSMELWVNGELASVQSGPSQGKTPLNAAFAWLPKEEGDFVLIARAINEDGQTSTSPAVMVTVGPNEEADADFTGQFADVPAIAPPLGGGGYSPPSGPGPGDLSGPADDWNGSPDNWLNSLNNDAPPAAPELVAVVDSAECRADLSIHDLSDNEDGFAVFFQANGGNWQQVATLAAQSQNEWIELADVHLVGGQTAFYVSAFNAHGEAQGNIVSMYKNPSDCTVDLLPADGPQVLVAQLTDLVLLGDDTPDKLYCYRSVNGGPMAKWPEQGYFFPDQDGLFSLDEVLQAVIQQPSAKNDEVSGEEASQYLILYLECWGWFGDDIEYLGSIDNDEITLGLGEATVVGNGLQAGIVFEALDGEGGGLKFGLGGGISAEFLGNINTTLKYLLPPDMVAPAAFVTYDPEQCTNHLMPEAQNLLGSILFCFPYPGFHGGYAEGDNPQPYLAWNFLHSCNLGYGWESEGGPCKSYGYWLQEAAANNGEIGFTVHDYSNAGNDKWDVSAPNLTLFNIPPNGCEGQRTFQVQMYYKHADGFVQYSPMSNAYTINCPKPVGSVLQLDFTFESLTLNNIDDGDSGTQDVEVYGYFQVIAPSSYPGENNYLKMGTWDKQNGDCSDDTGTGDNHRPSCPRILTNGTHNLYNIPLCPSTDYSGDDDWQCSFYYAPNAAQINNYAANQNTLRVDVLDGDAINIWVILWDWDDASGNDLVCWGHAEIPSKTIFEWDAMDGSSFGIVAFGDVSTGSTCHVDGVIHVN